MDARAFGWLVLGENVARPFLGALLLRYLGAPWWATCWFALSGFRLRLFYRRPQRPQERQP